MIYVRNLGEYTLVFSIKKGFERKGKEAPRGFPLTAFHPRTVNIHTGYVEHTGYTAVRKKDYELLLSFSPIFEANIHTGVFVKYDNPPQDALSSAEALAKLEEENRLLKEELNKKKPSKKKEKTEAEEDSSEPSLPSEPEF